MNRIDNNTPVSDLLNIKIGDDIIYGNHSGIVQQIDFEETNTYWEMILTLEDEKKIYLKKHKTSC